MTAEGPQPALYSQFLFNSNLLPNVGAYNRERQDAELEDEHERAREEGKIMLG